MLTNVLNLTHIVHDIPKVTDHSNISLSVRSLPRLGRPVRKVKRNFSDSNLCRINENLTMCDWDLNSTDVNRLYSEILENIVSCVDLVSPLVTFTIRDNHLPWYDKEVTVSAANRDEAYKNFRCSDGEYDRLHYWAVYKRWRNETVNLLKVKKANYYSSKIDVHARNSREMWKTLKTLIKPPPAGLPDVVVFNSQPVPLLAGSDQDKAEMFNNFFIDSVIDIRATIPTVAQWSSDGLPVVSCCMSNFSKLNLAQLKRLISNLDNRCSAARCCCQ